MTISVLAEREAEGPFTVVGNNDVSFFQWLSESEAYFVSEEGWNGEAGTRERQGTYFAKLG